jgi:type IV pilus assembly protein PilW
MTRRSLRSFHRRSRTSGFTLVELMVALVLGLVVMAGVASVFLSNQQVYRTNRALSDVQDSSRQAFELLARDIRNAGLTACSNSARVANVLNDGPVAGGSVWWANWDNAVRGYAGNDPVVAAGTKEGDRLADAHSLQLLGGDDSSHSVASHDTTAAQFVLNEASADYAAGDVFIVCDYDHAAIFKSSAYSASGKTVSHATTAGNCSTGLGFPTSCGSANFYTFGPNAFLTRLNVSDWYIGRNPEGGSSLYRFGRAGGSAPTRQEMVRGVMDLQLTYHQSDLATAFVEASEVTNWNNVSVVRAILRMQSNDERASTASAPIVRDLTMTTTVRNRVP